MEIPNTKVKIDLIKILVYYDGIQVFLGYDVESFEKYYCFQVPNLIKNQPEKYYYSDVDSLIKEQYDQDIYVAFKLTIQEHSMVLNEEYELLEFLNNRTHKEWYLGEFIPTSAKVLLVGKLQETEIPTEYLPTEKLFLNKFCNSNILHDFDEDY